MHGLPAGEGAESLKSRGSEESLILFPEKLVFNNNSPDIVMIV